MDRSNKPIPIYRFDNHIQADALLSMLTQENIPASKRLFEDSAYGGIYRPQYGMGEILIREEDSDKAKIIINKFKSISKKNNEDKHYKQWLESLSKRRRKNTIIFAILYVLFFFMLGLYILTHSTYKIMSGIFFLVALFFLFIFYVALKSTKSGRGVKSFKSIGGI